MPKRYDTDRAIYGSHESVGYMLEWPDGDYVKHSDYAKLQAERDELASLCDDMAAEMHDKWDCWGTCCDRDEIDEYQAMLDRYTKVRSHE